MAQITVLKQIIDSPLKQKVIMKLMNSVPILTLKDKYHRSLPLRVEHFKDDLFYCKGAVKVAFDFSYSESFLAHFTIGTEQYMFETAPQLLDGYIVLNLSRIFHLQSRQTVRYKVPENSNIKLIISSVNEEPCLIDSWVSDLNSYGCSFIVNSPNVALLAKDLIDATLINGEEGLIQIQGVIRNVRPIGESQVAVGVEFHHMLYSGEEKLASMMSELHQKAHLKSS